MKCNDLEVSQVESSSWARIVIELIDTCTTFASGLLMSERWAEEIWAHDKDNHIVYSVYTINIQTYKFMKLQRHVAKLNQYIFLLFLRWMIICLNSCDLWFGMTQIDNFQETDFIFNKDKRRVYFNKQKQKLFRNLAELDRKTGCYGLIYLRR